MAHVISRRDFIHLCAAAGLTGVLAPRAFAMQKTQFGAREVVVLSDGNLSLPASFMFPEIAKEELEPLLAANGLPTDMFLPDCNLTLVRDGERTIIFDAGSGANFQPTAGKLADSLAEAGVDPADITDVVFTHAHPDHLWGVVDDFDEFTFANANHHMSRMEWDYWRAPDTMEKTPEERKSFVAGAQKRFELLADRITLFDFGAEVLPGIEAVDTSGHTPGHASFVLHEGSQNLVIIGDAISQSVVSFQRPDWHSGSDQDPAKAARTRQSLLDRLVANGSTIIGFHLPHPGIGAVERDGSAYRFLAQT